MLQEKKKGGNGCTRLIIFIIISVFVLWTGFIVVIFVVFFIFVGGNKKNIDFGKILKKLGVYECAKSFFGDFHSRRNSDLPERSKGTFIQNYLEKMNNSIKKRSLELKKIEKKKEEKNIKTWEEIILQEKKDSIYHKENDINTIKYNTTENSKINNGYKINSKNKVNPIKKNNFKSSNNSFNNGKSIWDNYESVIDIMNKNK